MKSASIMGKMQDPAQSLDHNLVLRFSCLRRIPTRYQSTLPLKVMKRYRCAVVGSARGILTVATTHQRDISLIEALTKLTQCLIFPVWVKPARMRLLIHRMERWERRKDEMRRWPHTLDLFEIHAMVAALIDQMKKRKQQKYM